MQDHPPLPPLPSYTPHIPPLFAQWSVATTDICGTNTPHSFAEDDEGHVYTLTSQGIFRIEVQGGATTPQTFPQFYTCSGATRV